CTRYGSSYWYFDVW
nr:immunoglobulin heavy chain junction region [Mus musculus]